jgi:hypothetical protein
MKGLLDDMFIDAGEEGGGYLHVLIIHACFLVMFTKDLQAPVVVVVLFSGRVSTFLFFFVPSALAAGPPGEVEARRTTAEA